MRFFSLSGTIFYLEMPFPSKARFSIGRTYFLRSNISCTSIVLYLTSAVFHNGTLFLCELKARCKIAFGRFCEPKKSRVKCAPAPFHIAPALHNFATEKFIKTPPTYCAKTPHAYCAKESHRIDRISFFFGLRNNPSSQNVYILRFTLFAGQRKIFKAAPPRAPRLFI